MRSRRSRRLWATYTVDGFLRGLLAAVMIIVASVILSISDRYLPGMEVCGFAGAIVAAIAVIVVAWLRCEAPRLCMVPMARVFQQNVHH